MTVNLPETALVLAKAAAFDNRTVTESAARAWHEALDENMTAADAAVIVAEHYAETDRFIMPSHINARSRALRARRLQAHPEASLPAPPPSLDDDPAGQIEWRRALIRALGDGLDLEAADAHACSIVGGARPPQVATSARPVAQLLAGREVPRR